MLYLVMYDVKQERLPKVSKICVKYGVRVQNSVYECQLNRTEYAELKSKLLKIVNKKEDSIRIYRIRKWNKDDLEILGKEEIVEITKEGDIFL